LVSVSWLLGRLEGNGVKPVTMTCMNEMVWSLENRILCLEAIPRLEGQERGEIKREMEVSGPRMGLSKAKEVL
ncbi:MAG: hypothetical protein QNK38_05085, partial [Nitrospirota bacterium]|nr:hypothetical protein [Nitrospirota bacterium]MDX2420456.1 hypothetical protein [Nitrospirota bacterium]